MSFNERFLSYWKLLKIAEDGTFSDKPSNEKTEKDKKEDEKKKNGEKSTEQPKNGGNEVIGQATHEMQQPIPEGAESPIYEVLGPSIFQAASMGDENAKDVIARTAAEIVKSMMGMGGMQSGMGAGPVQQNPVTPEQQVANNIVPASIPPTMQPQYQNPNGVYTQAMQ
jgi:hypothetical protein